MPPASTRKTLSLLEMEIQRQWIADGAEYKRHWAFITPVRVPVPDDETILRTIAGAGAGAEADAANVDRFVYRRLAEEGVAPSARADKETLINRVSLTLTGLPPTLGQVDAFVADDSTDAYERLVDRLLASPRYAEHSAGFWMDIARYSESDGFLDDHHDRYFWPYRDWVIDAFANNMPFDEFGTLQLAGDLLPDATREQILATAYVRLGKRTTENGAIDEEYKAEYMVERTDNALGVAFLGLTLGCARCHDHRYDPISQHDYYSLGAFFNSTDEPGTYAPGHSAIQHGPTLAWPDDATQAEIETVLSALRGAEESHAVATEIAGDGAAAGAESLLMSSEGLASELSESIGAALVAHYPLDAATPAALDDLPAPLQRRDPPYDLVDLDYKAFAGQPGESEEDRFAREAALPIFRVPRNYVAEELTLSPSATRGVADAVLQAPIFRDGVVGNAMFFDETNRGFLGRNVGWYDRTDQPRLLVFRSRSLRARTGHQSPRRA